MITPESSITQGVRARALFEGHDIADSADVVVVRDPGHPPAYYFPRKDVFMVFLRETDKVTHNADKGEARYFTIYRDQHIVDNVAWSYEAPPPAFAAIAGRIAFQPAHVDFQVEGHSTADAQEDDDQEAGPA
ncbi:DUF427 domain-containing protein [Caulobacter sp. 602-1]|uniref:DUF427 domain-containing protein n=1 Tax=Caulobacter sp. 602-1 TaxID=2492472 RepID=UPI000F63E48F|nr:DUF427 domain-containing protein [Caulobacter sp. 602-1]RRN63958.1 DUF427 domain-containing protein [Caulobacter sp. 602-1]